MRTAEQSRGRIIANTGPRLRDVSVSANSILIIRPFRLLTNKLQARAAVNATSLNRPVEVNRLTIVSIHPNIESKFIAGRPDTGRPRPRLASSETVGALPTTSCATDVPSLTIVASSPRRQSLVGKIKTRPGHYFGEPHNYLILYMLLCLNFYMRNQINGGAFILKNPARALNNLIIFRQLTDWINITRWIQPQKRTKRFEAPEYLEVKRSAR